MTYRLLILFVMITLIPSWAVAEAGRWVNDRVTNCQIYAPEYSTSAFFEGNCVQGRINGYGSLSLYKGTELLNFIEGYFQSGMYIHNKQVDGELFIRGTDIFFHHNPNDNSRFQVISPVEMNFKNSSICGNQILIVTDRPIASMARATLADIAERTADRYSSLCRDLARNNAERAQISIVFQDAAAFNNNSAIAATVPAVFAGNRYRINEASLAGLGTDLDNGTEPLTRSSNSAEAARLLGDIAQPVVSELIRLKMSSRLESSQAFGFPACAAVVSIQNNDGLLVEQLAYKGIILDAAGQQLYDFIERPSAPLVSGAAMTNRTMLPHALCRSAANIKIVSIECRAGGEVISDCGKYVEGFTASLNAAGQNVARRIR